MKNLKTMISEGAGLVLNTDLEIQVRQLLQECYAEEVYCWYKYWIATEFLKGPSDRDCLEKLFEENAKDELYDHASRILKRLNQLDWSPENILNISDVSSFGNNAPWSRECLGPDGSFSTLCAGRTMLADEVTAIKRYTELEKITRDFDPVTNQIVKDILADEQEHYQALEDWIKDRESC